MYQVLTCNGRFAENMESIFRMTTAFVDGIVNFEIMGVFAKTRDLCDRVRTSYSPAKVDRTWIDDLSLRHCPLPGPSDIFSPRDFFFFVGVLYSNHQCFKMWKNWKRGSPLHFKPCHSDTLERVCDAMEYIGWMLWGLLAGGTMEQLYTMWETSTKKKNLFFGLHRFDNEPSLKFQYSFCHILYV